MLQPTTIQGTLLTKYLSNTELVSTGYRGSCAFATETDLVVLGNVPQEAHLNDYVRRCSKVARLIKYVEALACYSHVCTTLWLHDARMCTLRCLAMHALGLQAYRPPPHDNCSLSLHPRLRHSTLHRVPSCVGGARVLRG